MRKSLTLVMLSLVSAPMMLLLGCSSSGGSQPYKLTGTTPDQTADQQQWRRQMTYTDDKGHYHPEFAAQGRTLRAVPSQPTLQ